ncbi:uncharacterized protein LOC101239423 isoform X2 [Hydra vulgaris]|uniref:uncharacterized protein LOC101239423 isoform X2 n=1 Tax=Hydra vulgaris TaxID=6087 RepID=UPI0032E9E67A
MHFCPRNFSTDILYLTFYLKDGFLNRIVACSFVGRNCTYQLDGFFRSIDFPLANIPNSFFNQGNGVGYIYGNEGVFSMNVDGSLLTNIHNFDIYLTLAYYIQNGTYTLGVSDFPFYNLTNSSFTYKWNVLNKRYTLTKDNFYLTITGFGGLIILNSLCIYQVCSTGFEFNYLSDQCEDIDECNTFKPPCSWSNGKCYNTIGSYFCSCNTGWVLGEDNATCAYYLIGSVSTPISKGNGIALIPKLNNEYIVSLDIRIMRSLSINPNSIIHLTNCNNNKDNCYTVLSIYTLRDSLWIYTGKNRTNIWLDDLPDWFSINISQTYNGTVFYYAIKHNKKEIFSDLFNIAQTFSDIRVYASDPWTESEDSLIKNFKIINGISFSGMQPVVSIPKGINMDSVFIISKSYQQLLLSTRLINGTFNNYKVPLGLVFQYSEGSFNGNLYVLLYPLVYYGGFIKFSYVFFSHKKVNPIVRYSDSQNFNKYYFESKISFNDGYYFIDSIVGYNEITRNYQPDLSFPEYIKKYFTSSLPYYDVFFSDQRYTDSLAIMVQLIFTDIPSDLESVYWISYNISLQDLKGCSQGWILNKYKNGCIDDNECINFNPCWNNSVCENTEGSYFCLCLKGWILSDDNGSCLDINECSISNPCFWNNSKCENTYGSYLCSCADGWLLSNDNVSCVDYNECISNPCFWNNSICENKMGSYLCSCASGWLLGNDKASCVDINECSISNPCFWNNSKCENTYGSYLCSCADGWLLSNDNVSCVDYNECISNPCFWNNSVCENKMGSFLCSCASGWLLGNDKASCVDNNECLTSNPCSWTNSLCKNTIGSFLCSCSNGWLLGADEASCVDNNECVTSNPCYWNNSMCRNTIGTYVCLCKNGWLLGDDEASCVDNNECITSNPCFWTNSICNNTMGGYSCSCLNGWVLGNNNVSCVEIPNNTGDNTSYIIAAAVLTPLLVVGITLFVVLRIRCHKQNKFSSNSSLYIYSNSEEYYKVSPDEWKISNKNIVLDQKIGEGAFGNVFIAKINANIIAKTKYFNKTSIHGTFQKRFNIDADVNVAVKVLKDGASQSELNDFIEEINLMKGIGYHKNIVNIIGCCTIKKSLALIVEFMQEGDLLHFLRNKRAKLCMLNQESEPAVNFVYTSQYQKDLETISKAKNEIPLAEMGSLTPSDLLCFAWQVASGMEYLACMKLVHRDLAARNILVGADKNLKISDFGLTRKVDLDVYMGNKSRRLPIKWMSIEAIFDRTFTSSSDVWSYGVVLFEIITLGGTPYPTITNNELLTLLKSGYRMERPDNCSQPMYDIMMRCWHENPLLRPTFTELRELFDKVLSGDYSYVSLIINEASNYYNLSYSQNTLGEAIDHVVEV